MNLIFKIVEYLPETDQIIVKLCRQNAPKPIDEYPPVAINCSNLDLTDYYQFVVSIMKNGLSVILKQEEEEETLKQNKSSALLETTDITQQLNRVISIHSEELIEGLRQLNKVKLDELNL
jgi:hypothetical protein